MTKFLRFGAAGVAVAAALATAPAFAQSNQASADARAEILSALTLEVATGTTLDFGAVVIQNTASAATLVMGDDGVLDCSDANLVCSGTTDVPVFDISGGTANKTVTISFDSTSVNLYLGGTPSVDPTEYLVLDTFTSDATLNPAQNNVPVLDPYGVQTGTVNIPAYYSTTLDGSGAGSFTIGGSLHFDGNEVAGVYSGSVPVTVDYL
ncbi:DUF4402 domain-containing protein [Altererythrobacter arenosus]|uniref:DUF4402 domain-containing protein n=1 Tax=Altererythrobacter arenosus TaxID=3032592 RepID=A0ABY8FZC4_9SPHN|nr:DUF4402 domain-containing protein [Altererythrobacter sp. CAU 1644]WFL78666.1 DUF4402 domain-containing protein [Altererythrobacter sp. CAU 1644]